jgi:single-stranded-DNA-specific exonuclease
LRNWKIAEPLPAEANAELSAYPAIVRQLLYNRGCPTANQAEQYLNCNGPTHSPFLLADMDKAIECIWQTIQADQPIAVYGDYDVDGVTATALLVQVLRCFGASVEAYIPNRFEEGYGLNNDALDVLAQNGTHLIITVDCGIRSPVEVEHARALGMEIIISDHHHPQGNLPHAAAVICQRRPDNTYPDPNLAGVGLAYKIAQALLERHPLEGHSAEEWLDLVALGTIADIVPLTGENRNLVRTGLNRLRQGQRVGLHALAQAAGIAMERLTASDVGFSLGPRLNAAGRLESALAAYALLMAKDVQEAGLLAQKLDDQNRQRQSLTHELQKTAEELIAADPSEGSLVFVAHPNFSSGVVGLVAARLVETYYRPAIVGQIGETCTRASCRSISEFHITEALDQCADLMERHGGHSMAAGFTIRNEHLPELRRRLNTIAQQKLGGMELRPTLRADLEIPLSALQPGLLLPYLDRLQPTGMGNPEAVFVSRGLRVTQARAIGKEQTHLRLVVTDGNIYYDAIAFRMGAWATQIPPKVDLLYTFERNNYQGRESLQLVVRDLKPA